MKNRIEEWQDDAGTETLAVFGEARVVRRNGLVLIEGGSMADRMEALEWMAENIPGTRTPRVTSQNARKS